MHIRIHTCTCKYSIYDIFNSYEHMSEVFVLYTVVDLFSCRLSRPEVRIHVWDSVGGAAGSGAGTRCGPPHTNHYRCVTSSVGGKRRSGQCTSCWL